MRKGQPDLRFDLDLVDAFQLVLDGILDREDVILAGVEAQQRGVQRGRLAAAGRPGDQQDPVRPLENAEIRFEGVTVEAELGKVERDRSPVQDPQDHTFAVHGGHGGDAEIDLFATYRQLDTPILGKARLGDVQFRHDLDA